MSTDGLAPYEGIRRPHIEFGEPEDNAQDHGPEAQRRRRVLKAVLLLLKAQIPADLRETVETQPVMLVRWLLSDNPKARRTGRSRVMAVAYVIEALEIPGRWVAIRDHYPSTDADRTLGWEVHRLIDIVTRQFPHEGFSFSSHNRGSKIQFTWDEKEGLRKR